jgi:hypothetical protein
MAATVFDPDGALRKRVRRGNLGLLCRRRGHILARAIRTPWGDFIVWRDPVTGRLDQYDWLEEVPLTAETACACRRMHPIRNSREIDRVCEDYVEGASSDLVVWRTV